MTEQTTTDDKAMLLDHLNGQRRHVLGILEGLSEEDLRRAVVPSGWTCLGLVYHLALDVERFWFRAVVAGEQTIIQAVLDGLEKTGDAWEDPPDVPAEEIFTLYRQDIERADAIITATPLDAPPAWWPDFFPNFRLQDLREVILHVITETACHAGHLDIVREIIDGRQWMVLNDEP
jgi:uncharacterized damage-inducible protein DinB